MRVIALIGLLVFVATMLGAFWIAIDDGDPQMALLGALSGIAGIELARRSVGATDGWPAIDVARALIVAAALAVGAASASSSAVRILLGVLAVVIPIGQLAIALSFSRGTDRRTERS